MARLILAAARRARAVRPPVVLADRAQAAILDLLQGEPLAAILAQAEAAILVGQAVILDSVLAAPPAVILDSVLAALPVVTPAA